MRTKQFTKTILAGAVAVLLFPISGGAAPSQTKHFGHNRPFTVDQLPSSQVKSRLNELHGDKQRRAMSWLHSFDFTQYDLEHMIIDNEGGVLYGDSFDMTELTEIVVDSTVQAQSITPAYTFKLHSKPGATNVIFIDVDGHTISNTGWNSSSSSIQARPFDTDGDSQSFSDAELATIAEIWHRIAEDFAPFDVDITTEEPSSFNSTTGHILITHNKDTSGLDMPYSTSGGVAYVNVWGASNYASYYSPALVYYNNLASAATYISEAATHEMGHNLGLSHDGSSSETYYAGHGNGFVSWGAIMGVGYYSNMTQWSKGEYTDATQLQDDISIISNHLSFRADDHGNDIYSPSELLVDVLGNINVTSPELDAYNQSPENKGIIETRDDIDFFSFNAGAGPLEITVTPAWDSFYRSSLRGSNLDVEVKLYNWDGQLIQTSDPLDETDAQITATIESGQYLLAVSGVGNTVTPYSDYGSLGQYFISGKIEPFVDVVDNTPPTPNPMGWTVAPFGQSQTSISMQANTASDDSGSVQYNFICVSGAGCVDSGWQASNQYTATGLQAGGSYSFQVSARDASLNETNPSTIASAITDANNPPQTENSFVNTLEDTVVLVDLAAQSFDVDSDPLTFTIQSQPVFGSVVNHNNGTVSYTPNSNFNGEDSFSYLVSDGLGGSANATVAISVSAVNDAPVANAVAPISSETLTVSFSSNDSFDVDTNDTLSYLWDFGDNSSSTSANPDHSYSVDGSYNVTLTVSDSSGASDTMDITITLLDPGSIMPEVPTNLSAIVDKTVTGRGKNKVVSGTISLSWDPVDVATDYNIWSCTVVKSGRGSNRTTSCTFSLLATTSNTSYDVPLTADTMKFKVNAENANGTSDFSNRITVKP